ncbi:MAG: fibrobacter succinogenes major paralogous domain-containing protein [Bacteroidetes bacterium]|nr:fibrobacter succinogenes major paralogous domain-containing protein [Bacteroidota bacterium]
MKTLLPSLKPMLLTVILTLFALPGIQAQNNPVTPSKLYNMWFFPDNSEKRHHWMLFELKDSAVILSESHSKQEYSNGNYELTKVDIKDIDVIKVRRKGAGAAIAIGGVTGVILGAIISVAYGSTHHESGMLGEPVPVAESVIPIFLSTAIGFGAGILLASKIKIPIHRSQQAYENNKQALNDYAIMGATILKINAGVSFSRLPDSVADIDGNYYHTLALGGQVWLAENLRVAHFRNGDAVTEVTENTRWGKLLNAACCWYQNNKTRGSSYGALYNWSAAADSRGLCPKGWHVPSMPEWESMVACLGGGTEAGKKLSSGIVNKAGGGTGATTIADPFARPGGFRFSPGEFSLLNAPSCQWWSSTPQDPAVSKTIQLGNNDSGLFFTGSDNRSGLSVRCLRD